MAIALSPLSHSEQHVEARLRAHVQHLSSVVGERHLGRYDALLAAAEYIRDRLGETGDRLDVQEFRVEGLDVHNVELEHEGRDGRGEALVLGAHYDSVPQSPGANDNGSGVAALIELARLSSRMTTARAVRFVAFVNEEPPYFMTPQMGSVVYARRTRQRGERLTGMLSLETIGCYFDAPNTQQYPAPFQWFYPSTGNFLAMVSNFASAQLLRRAARAFRAHTALPLESAPAPASIPGVGWSDHWAFWQQGYRALMVTDTAPYRYPYYHTPADTAEKLDYGRMARAVTGLLGVVATLAAAVPDGGPPGRTVSEDGRR
jgi:hypothetical protein